ncbi:hypothetical protein [Pedobacter sp. ASV28]|uniref:hypothetical protein n=1 Tax=Pedobacter sp. ASV28 TaxID=2795123 RepID=UPI0018EE11FD|nr:hypothetical protein [Pedobacter sp. ASV28]
MKDINDELLIVTVAKQCARISLFIGTSIFLLFAISGVGEVMILGAFFIGLAIFANGLILFILSLHLINHRAAWRKILLAAVLMLSNIPIALFFVWLSVQISDLNHIKL